MKMILTTVQRQPAVYGLHSSPTIWSWVFQSDWCTGGPSRFLEVCVTMICRFGLVAWGVLLSVTASAMSAEHILTPQFHHLRLGAQPEWSDFPAGPGAAKLELKFQGQANPAEWSLCLRQSDVRDSWKVSINGREIGRLQQDENDMISCLIVPANTLKDGENSLVIEQTGKLVDDIRVGEVVLHDQSQDRLLSAAAAEISVVDGNDEGDVKLLPSRLTITNLQGSLVPIGTRSSDKLAVRTGVVYTSTGHATLGLPAGEYVIHAGRGFEYGVDSTRVKVDAGGRIRRTLRIKREVSTLGYVSCDTHIHTLTHSGHGDATEAERMITLAGEGIELPIATDHNVQIDYQATAQKLDVQQHFTPVIGNEVTTAIGHFNVFPLSSTDPVPEFKVSDWKTLFDGLLKTDRPRVIILNHARDLHSKFRPFGSEHHIALTGENLDGWNLRANGMEIINSGAQQTDPLQLTHDWMGLLNRGVILTPVGASDSHDVSRFIVGQGRTYIRCPDHQPGDIPVAEAIDSFLKGRVLVSCGLLAEIAVNGQYGPGALVPPADEVNVNLHVSGPSWVQADKLELYANGIKIKDAIIEPKNVAGVKWAATWTVPRFRHDVHLVAVATGPGITKPYWPIARPYQPMSPVVNSRVMGVTGAVWIDGDGDNKRSCAAEYAERLWTASGKDANKFVESLKDYDEAVAHQAASILKRNQVSLKETAKQATPAIQHAFQAYEEAWRASQIAKGS